jgi:flagellar biosynthesis component FlhA
VASQRVADDGDRHPRGPRRTARAPAVIEPAFGLPAWWIDARAAHTLAEARGYTVVEPDVVLATHLSELIKAHAPELVSPPGRAD